MVQLLRKSLGYYYFLNKTKSLHLSQRKRLVFTEEHVHNCLEQLSSRSPKCRKNPSVFEQVDCRMNRWVAERTGGLQNEQVGCRTNRGAATPWSLVRGDGNKHGT